MKSIVVRRPHDVDLCVDHLKRGEVIALPTDTVYGIVCSAFNIEAIHEIYRLKGRSYTKALPLLLGDVSQLPLVAEDIQPEVYKLIEKFWPGPLTLVFKTAPLALPATRGKSTVALRIPNDPLVLKISRLLGVPLASTSANLSGEKSAVEFGPVLAAFDKKVPLLIDGGLCPLSIESTVIDVTHYPFTVIREGAVPKSTILKVLTT